MGARNRAVVCVLMLLLAGCERKELEPAAKAGRTAPLTAGAAPPPGEAAPLIGGSPSQTGALLLQVETHLQQQRFQEALPLLDELILREPQVTAHYDKRSVVNYNLHRFEAVIPDATRALEQLEAMPQPDARPLLSVLVRRGAALLNLGRCEEAVKDFNRALEHGDGAAFVYYDRGRCYLALGRREEAMRDFRKVLELDAEPHIQASSREFLSGRMH